MAFLNIESQAGDNACRTLFFPTSKFLHLKIEFCHPHSKSKAFDQASIPRRIYTEHNLRTSDGNMACPVNSPAFHALFFLLGLLIVLGRYVKGAEISNLASTAGAQRRCTTSAHRCGNIASCRLMTAKDRSLSMGQHQSA
ncbi:hypothetical protein CF319_g9582 [Tilletia indica]|nr:hypothetical protein CF319_g9582 [Tilletia indica]